MRALAEGIYGEEKVGITMKCSALGLIVLTALLLLSSCSPGVPADMTGKLISDDPRLQIHFLLWTPDDTRIVYGGTVWDDPGYRAEMYTVNVQTLSREVIENTAGILTNVKMSADGEAIFYTITDPGSLRHWLYRRSLQTGERELLVDGEVASVSEGFPLFEQSRIAVSPDRVHLAYAKRAPEHQRHAYVHNLQTREERFLAEGVPVAFSPDGSQLLFHSREDDDGADSWAIIPVAGGEAQPLNLDGAGYLSLVRWDFQGIRFLVRGTLPDPFRWELFIHNATTGERQALWSSTDFPDFPHAWSPDGRKIGFRTFRCLRSSGFLGRCESGQDSLHVIDTATNTATRAERVVARLTDRGIGPIAFSHDGGRVAYGSGGRIYVSDLP